MTISDQQIFSIFTNEMNLYMNTFWKQIGLAVFVSLFMILIYSFYKYKKNKKLKINIKKSILSFIIVFLLCSLSATPSFINFIQYNNYLSNINNLNVVNVKITEKKQLNEKSEFYIYFTHNDKVKSVDVLDSFLYSTLEKNNSVVIIYEDDIEEPLYIMKGKYSGSKFK